MATIYARQSVDRHGDSLAVERQLDLCRAYCQRHGWTVDAEIVDNDRSATSGAERPGFERLLRSSPERVVVWHVDRLVRLTRDLERVIDLGVNVHAVEAGHLDLSNPAGRAVARTVTAWATYEGEQKAARQKASNDQRAASGRPSAGRRTFGYSPDGMAIVEDEARHTRAAVAAILAGTPLRTVVRSLKEQGVRTTAGNTWEPSNFRNYLRNPRLAAQRVHRGEVVGEGIWPAIITLDEHVAVCAVLNDPSRQSRGRPRTYLLSGVARCGKCGAKIYGRVERRGPIYVCESHAHLGRKIADIDSFIERLVVGRLAMPDAAEVFTRPETSGRVESLRLERRQLVSRLDGLAEAFAAGEIDRRQLTAGTTRLRDRLEAVDAELPGLVATSALTPLVTATDVEQAWADLDVASRREVVRTLVDVDIHPAGRGARYFNPETVTLTWKATA